MPKKNYPNLQESKSLNATLQRLKTAYYRRDDESFETALPELISEIDQTLSSERMTIPAHSLFDTLPPSSHQTELPNQINDVELPAGTICGPYRIENLLGEGGMGRVYLAVRDDDLNLRVALKVLTQRHLESIDLFRRECRVLSGLQHSNIAHLIDAGIFEDGQSWLAMEYVEGITLHDYLKQHELSLDQLIELFLKVCDAIIYAHGQMIIHRDLKPKNIMVKPDGEPKLLDFGIATSVDPSTGSQNTITMIQGRMLTPDYASPEQISGERMSTVSDVYSLGVILYHMLTGEKPYHVFTTEPVQMVKVVMESTIIKPSALRVEGKLTPLAPQLNGDLDTIILKAMERDTQQRYASVAALAHDLRLFLDGQPILARPSSTLYRLRKWVRRHPWPTFSAGSFIIFLISFAIYAQYQRVQIERQAALVRKEQQTSEQVTQFLLDMFRSIDPDLAQGRQISVQEVFESGRAKIDNFNIGDADVNARLLMTLADVYRSIGDYHQAADLLEKGLKFETTDQIDLPLKLAVLRMRLQLNQIQPAADLLDDIKKQVATEDQRATYQLARANYLKLLGRIAEADEMYASAAPVFFKKPLDQQVSFRLEWADFRSLCGQAQQAIEILQPLVETSNSDQLLVSDQLNSSTSLANLYLETNNLDAAEASLDSTERLCRKVFGEDHPYNDKLHLVRAKLLMLQMDFAKAEALYIETLMHIQDQYGRRNTFYIQTLFEFAKSQTTSRNIAEGEALLRQALDLCLELFEVDHPLTLAVRFELGLLLFQADQPDAAEASFLAFIAAMENVFPDSHPKIALALRHLGSIEVYKRNYDAAETHYEHALQKMKRFYGSDHPETLELLLSIAQLKFDTNRREEALNLSAEVLQRRRKIHGLQHPKVAQVLVKRGDYLRWLKRYDESRQQLDEAITILEATPNADRLITSEAYNSRGALYINTGHFEEALVVLDKAIEAEKLTPNFTSFYLGDIYVNKAETLSFLGRHQAAIKMFDECFKVFDATFGKTAPDFILILHHKRGLLRQRYGDYAGAADDYKRFAEGMLRVFEPNHFRAMRSYHCRGRLALLRGDLQTAKERLQEVRAITDEHFVENYKELFWVEVLELQIALITNSENRAEALARLKENVTHNALRSRGLLVDIYEVRFLTSIGELKAAENLARASLSKALEWYGINHHRTAAIYLQLAETLAVAKQPEAALENLDAAGIYMDEYLIPDHENRWVMMSLRGMIQAQLGNQNEARRLLSQAYKGLRQKFSDSHHLTREAYNRIESLPNNH